jgi:hypothetical protein
MPPKGGNAKKESGRAKKAENEANKKAQAEADKVLLLPVNSRNRGLCLTNTNRKRKKLKHGKTAEKAESLPRRRKRRSEKRSSLGRLKMHGCLQKKRRRPLPKSNLHRNLPRSNQNLRGLVQSLQGIH